MADGKWEKCAGKETTQRTKYPNAAKIRQFTPIKNIYANHSGGIRRKASTQLVRCVCATDKTLDTSYKVLGAKHQKH